MSDSNADPYRKVFFIAVGTAFGLLSLGIIAVVTQVSFNASTGTKVDNIGADILEMKTDFKDLTKEVKQSAESSMKIANDLYLQATSDITSIRDRVRAVELEMAASRGDNDGTN